MRGLFEHKMHLVRVGGLFASGAVLFLILQSLLVPEGFGELGHYRSGALADNRDRSLVHAGRAACLDCHSDAVDAGRGGPHAGVRCEACHGPLARHAADPAELKPQRPDPRVLCARCHQANVTRPAGFPQVEVTDHAGGETCTSCHGAHDPRPQPDGPAPAAAAAPKPAASEGGKR